MRTDSREVLELRSEGLSSKVKGALLAFLILALFVASTGLKLRLYPDRALYVSDAAMRYRYAKMIADGGSIPEVDLKVQAPEGLRVRSLEFLLEDKTVGLSYRLMSRLKRDLPFDVHMKWFVCLFSSIAVFPAYLAGAAIWKNRAAGAVAAAFYAVSVPSFERMIGSYLREEFALPFMFLSFSFFVASGVQRRNPRLADVHAALSGAFLFLALSSWHLTSFYLLLFLLSAGVSGLMGDLKSFLRPMPYIIGFAILAGLLNEPLRQRAFLASPPMILGYCLVVCYAVSLRLEPGKRTLAVLLAFLLAASAIPALTLSPRAAEYGHVYSLILAKARFLLDKPSDPGLLSPDARLLWMGPFQSPSLFSFLFGFGALVTAAVFPFAYTAARFLRRKAADAEALLLCMSVVFFVFFLFVRRLEVFAVFFLALLMGGVLRVRSRRWLVLALVLISLVFAFEVYKTVTFLQPTPVKRALMSIKRPEVERPSIHDRDRTEIFRWIRSSTPQDAVFLARFPASAMVVTYGQRASVLHPVFENKHIRDKVLECAGAFYGVEEALHRVCAKYEVDFVLYEANQLLDNSELGERYFTDNLELTTNSAAFLMHFAPEYLRYFTPVFQTEYFRVFKVRSEPGPVTPVLLKYSAQYDPDLFMVDKMGPIFSDSLVALAWRKIETVFGFAAQGRELMEQGRLREASKVLEEALTIMPRLDGARFAVADCYRGTGRPDLAAVSYRTLIEMDTFNVLAYVSLARLYREQDLLTTAVEVLQDGLDRVPENTDLLLELAYTRVELGDTSAALKNYDEILRFDPSNETARAALEMLRSGGTR